MSCSELYIWRSSSQVIDIITMETQASGLEVLCWYREWLRMSSRPGPLHTWHSQVAVPEHLQFTMS